jgi:hypothetical protein
MRVSYDGWRGLVIANYNIYLNKKRLFSKPLKDIAVQVGDATMFNQVLPPVP